MTAPGRPDGDGALLLRGGHVVDPSQAINGRADILIADGVVAAVGADLLPVEGATVVEVPAGLVVCPGFIDMHVHLREPGQTHKETVATGAAAAVAGGFTAVACMPNTDPVNDHAGVTEEILRKATEARLARVYPIGAVSVGSAGEQMTEVAALRDAGCVGISDDGHPVSSALMMRRALEYAAMVGLPVINHCEDPSLADGCSVHEGFRAAQLGLRGQPAETESIMVARDVSLSGLTGGPYHVAHMSAAASLRAIRDGKDRDVPVTCEVTPHHFILTDEDLRYDTNYKMNPPLRAASDRDAMLAGLADGTIDAIATDHAPHHSDEKAREFEHAPFGIIGLETAVSLSLDRLVHRGVVPLGRMVELYTCNPARILGIPGGSLATGSPADITILAPDTEIEVSADRFRSKARNTPFDGWRLRGAVAAAVVGGRVVYSNDAAPGAAAIAWPEQ
ncbi:MAG: dihydroorotase [Acidobacteria bacterium]|nr:dihydroorotase [Acidobacteriota bacterium]